MSTERLMELLTEQTERPLSSNERVELERLVAHEAGWSADDFELAAAATAVALLEREETMPETLKDRVMDELSTDVLATATVQVRAERPKESRRRPSARPPRRARPLAAIGWIVAAAALILLAVIIGWPKPPAPSAIELRAQMMKDPNAVKLVWTKAKDALSPSTEGDVVWNTKTQTGYMRFKGLAKNDPKANQYQLWIFDGTRSDATPVDGGVFDISAEGDVVVPIDAKLPVFEPTLFAVTVERPGGVVVSKRERIVVLAQVEG
ncbi:MAG: anti-sigma factor [Deltaproteobacteria bacterium]